MRCETCNHESKEPEPHMPGDCKQCNCGQSEIRHLIHPLARDSRAYNYEGKSFDSGKRVVPAKQI